MRAFSLIETVIVIALSASVMMAITLLVLNFNTLSAFNAASTKSSGSASALLRNIESLALPASAVLEAHSFSSSLLTSSSTALVLQIPSIDSSGNVIPNAYDYGAFYLVGTNAYRLLETNAASARAPGTKQLSSVVSTLTFSYDSATIASTSAVTVDIQTQASVKQNSVSDHLHEQIRLRNY